MIITGNVWLLWFFNKHFIIVLPYIYVLTKQNKIVHMKTIWEINITYSKHTKNHHLLELTGIYVYV